MRIKIVQKPGTPSVDGVRLDRFRVGQQYELGTTLASLLLAEGWAKPADEADDAPVQAAQRPANLIRELFPPHFELPALAANRRRRPHRRRQRSE